MANLEDPCNDSGLQVAMEDIMDVITLYKCKFCSFSCGQPSDIRQHVQDIHVVQEITEGELTVQPDPSQNIPLQIIDEKNTQVDPTVQEEQIQDVTQTDDPVVEQEEMQENVALVSVPEGEEGNAQQMEDTIISEGFAQGGVAECATDTVELSQDMPESNQLSLNRDLTELYLCGQCNLGFESIENCKTHIVKDHNAPVDENIVDYEEISQDIEQNIQEENVVEGNPSPGKISIGTQVMSRKKPGRKPKMKDDSDVKTLNKEEYEEEEVAVIEEDRLKQQEEEYDNSQVGTDGRTRRKRKLPDRLKQLYYIGKPAANKRASPPEKRFKTVSFKMACTKRNCNAKFRTEESLEVHTACHKVLLHQGQAYESFSCVKCAYYTPQWKVMRMHLWREHEVDTDLYSCGLCEFKSDTIGRVQRHSQIHGDARPFVCRECGKGFKQLTQLHNHKMTHASKFADPDKWYTAKDCDICERTFANVKCLKNHIEIVHGKEKPFVCPYCSHSTSRKAVLDLHIRTHTGDKPFKCDVCAYVTGDHNSLRRHRMRHTGERPYKCKYCTYSAIQAVSLKAHLRAKHPGSEALFTCDQCNYRSVNEQHFNNHLLDHKNGLISSAPPKPPKPPKNNFVVATPTVTGLTPTGNILTYNGQQISAIEIPTTTAEQSMQPDPNQTNNVILSTVANLSMVQGDANTARIIYSALGALSNKNNPNEQQVGTEEVTDLAQESTVQSDTQDGITTHTITLHIPNSDDPNGESKAQTIQIQNVPQTQPSEVETSIETASGATIEEGQVLLALQTQDQGQGQGHLALENGEIVYTTAEIQHQFQQENSDSVQHLVSTAQENIMAQTGSAITTMAEGTNVMPVDIADTTAMDVAQNKLTENQIQRQEPLVMNIIEDGVPDGHVQYITIAPHNQ